MNLTLREYSQSENLYFRQLPPELACLIDHFLDKGNQEMRLVNLFPVPDLEFVRDLSEFGVIAGGSVVYSLCNDMKPESVGDIDIFILNSEENFRKVLDLIVSYSKRNGLSCDFSLRDESLVNASVGNKKLEIVCSDRESPLEVLNCFDFDYVKCGFYQGKFLQTEDCTRALNERKIRRFRSPLCPRRILKACRKGFNIPMIFNTFRVNAPKKLVPTTYEALLSQKPNFRALEIYAGQPTEEMEYPSSISFKWSNGFLVSPSIKTPHGFGEYLGITLNIEECHRRRKILFDLYLIDSFRIALKKQCPWYSFFSRIESSASFEIFKKKCPQYPSFSKEASGLCFCVVVIESRHKPATGYSYFCKICMAFPIRDQDRDREYIGFRPEDIQEYFSGKNEKI